MIKNEIKKLLSDQFKKNDFQINFKLKKNDEDWDNFLESQTFIHDDYSSYVIEYRNLYITKNYQNELLDISVKILFRKKIIALWPLSLISNNGKHSISSQNLPIIEPLFEQNLSYKNEKRIVNSCIEILSELRIMLKINKLLVNDKFRMINSISNWHKKNIMISKNVYSDYMLYTDLTKDINVIKSQIRPSYKSLTSSAFKNYKIKICCELSKNSLKEFIEFHKKIAGKKTRSNTTWLFQLKNINNRKSFLVEIRNSKELLGFALFRHTRDEGFYEVGAYNRGAKYNNLSHGAIFAAIQELKKRGCKWLYLGDLNFESKYTKPNKKEISISFFEQGFATHIFHYNTFEI